MEPAVIPAGRVAHSVVNFLSLTKAYGDTVRNQYLLKHLLLIRLLLLQ